MMQQPQSALGSNQVFLFAKQHYTCVHTVAACINAVSDTPGDPERRSTLSLEERI